MAGEKNKSKILIVDDTWTSIDMIKSVLEEEGYEVVVATSGEEALKRAERKNLDLILVEVQMPGMDGFEICRHLKTGEITREIPVIFMTALGDSESKIKGFEVGGLDYVTKPIEVEEVLARIKTHLTLRKIFKELEIKNERLQQEVSERQRAEETVRKLNIDLEQRMEKRTGELSTVNELLKKEIEERTQREEELKESEERYRLAIENSNDGIVMIGGDRFIFVNQKFIEIFGYDRSEEVVGQPISLVVDPDDRHRVMDFNLQRQRGEAVPSRYEFKGIRKDGGEVFIEVSATKTSYRGEIVVLSFLRDITERKKLESLLHQAQKMEAIGTLAGGIAHDFNNILAVILGGVELALLEMSKESPVQSYLLEVLKATERATDLVRQILTFSRQKELERKPLQLSILCKEALKMLRASLPATIEIQQTIDSRSGTALVDPTQIHQIVMNLCSNAAHAMQEKGGLLRFTLGKVDISAEEESVLDLKAGPYIEMTVSDTGYGIYSADLKRIFDPYFTTKGIGEGTGLGLAVVHGIVRGYRGTIKVQSEPGKGTTFQVYIPRIDREKGGETAVKAMVLPRGNERILFVDDEEAITRIGQKMLEHLGYKVMITTSSYEALEIFMRESGKIDLVITDYILPKMTGTELAQKIIRIRPDIPIILITGLGDIMTAAQKNAMGIRKFIMKPLVIHSLAEKVRQVLDQKPGRGL